MTASNGTARTPITPMLTLYLEAKRIGAKELLARVEGEAAAAYASEVAEAFAATITQFATEYEAPDEAFRPDVRTPDRLVAEPSVDVLAEAEEETSIPEIRIARDVATEIYLSGQPMRVVDRPELDAEYVDYEVSILRTLGGARFVEQPGHDKSGAVAGRALVADLLLRGPGDLPVIGEVKLRGDSSPILGLIQVLTYIAHLAPAGQYRRLSIAPGSGERSPFRPHDAGGPLFGGLVLVVDGPELDAPGKVAALHRTAPRFAAALRGQDEISAVVGGLEVLRLNLQDGRLQKTGGAVTARTSAEAASSS
ncbi:MAG: hypothetical protein Q7T55_10275 [Solirubrobacteraceae bacterium]|nr:hypothetical protein [Solirubrobacteraceae bacterium]